MIGFYNPKASKLPEGYSFELEKPPVLQDLNKLFARCNEDTYPLGKLALALQNSFCNLCVLEDDSEKLVGFVRVTSDKGLNANLWNLVAEPGRNQEQLISALVNFSLGIIRREMPGCSVSIAAPVIALDVLQNQGFLLDPGGIRSMAYRLR